MAVHPVPPRIVAIGIPELSLSSALVIERVTIDI
jgi:hypothetical protein